MPSRDRTPTTALSRGGAGSLQELAARYLEEYREKIALAVEPLDEAALWWRPDEGSNGIGNLLLHLAGNLSLWILAGVGGEPYERDRTGEFAARGEDSGEAGYRKEELLARLDEVVERATAVLRNLEPEDLAAPRAIQGYEGLTVLDAVFHAVEHTSYHTGQIVFAAKQLDGGREMELYPRHRGE